MSNDWIEAVVVGDRIIVVHRDNGPRCHEHALTDEQVGQLEKLRSAHDYAEQKLMRGLIAQDSTPVHEGN